MMSHGAASILALGLLMGCSSSTGEANPSADSRPAQEVEWKGQGGGWREWGETANGFFGATVKPHVLEWWTWHDAVPQKSQSVELPHLLNVVVLPGGRYVACMSPGNDRDPWPLVLGSLASQDVVRKWSAIVGWTYSHIGTSRNGRFVALTMNPESYARDGERHRVGLIDVSSLELRWVGELTGHGGNTIRQVGVADDGEHIAVGGWDNGIALVSTSLQKVLWNQRPPTEVSTGYLVFTSDGLKMYAGGSEGCVYALETRTGKILSQWYATPTGKPLYGHRISCLAISPDDAWVAAGTGPAGQVYVFRANSNDKVRILPHGLTTTMLVSFSSNSERLATVAGGTIKVWSIKPSPQR